MTDQVFPSAKIIYCDNKPSSNSHIGTALPHTSYHKIHSDIGKRPVDVVHTDPQLEVVEKIKSA